MENIIIYGAGGFGREVHVLIKQINKVSKKFNLLGFIDDDPELLRRMVNDVPVLGNANYLAEVKSPTVLAMALLTSQKEKILRRLRLNAFLKYTNLIHPAIYLDETIQIGEGNILCQGMTMTCNIEIGNFNVFNGNVALGHDVKIGDYNLLGPNAFVAGEVTIGNANHFAMNTSILQQKTIGDRNTVNMNSVLIRNIKNDGVYFGIPAMKQTF